MLPNGFSDYCPVQVAYTDNIDPNGDGDLTDAVWHHTGVSPTSPGDNGIGSSANQGAQPVVDNHGGARHLVHDRGVQHVDRPWHLLQALHQRRRELRRDQPDQQARPVAGQPKSRRPAAAQERAGSRPRPPRRSVFNPVDNSLNYIVQNNINRAKSGADISFTKSKDYGITWSHMTTVSVNGSGDSRRRTTSSSRGWTSTPKGKLRAIWFDNRNAPDNIGIETFQGRSGDQRGATGPTRTSARSRGTRTGASSARVRFIGDYNGFAAGDGVMYPLWTDGRDTPGPPHGQTDIWTNVELRNSP